MSSRSLRTLRPLVRSTSYYNAGTLSIHPSSSILFYTSQRYYAGKATGYFNEGVGKAKEATGKVTGNEDLQRSGKEQQAYGSGQVAGSELKGAANQATQDIKQGWENVKDTTKNTMDSAAASPTGQKVKQGWEQVKDTSQKVGAAVGSTVDQAKEGVKQGWEKGKSAAKEAGKDAENEVEKKESDTYNKHTGKRETDQSGVERAAEAVSSMAAGVGEKVTQGAKYVADKVKETVGGENKTKK